MVKLDTQTESSGARSGKLSNLNLLIPALLAGGLSWLLVMLVTQFWESGSTLGLVALVCAATVLLSFGLLALLYHLQPQLRRFNWLQIDRRMPVAHSVQELRDMTPYLDLLNQQVAGALADAERSVSAILQNMERINEGAVTVLANVDQSKLGGSKLLNTVQEKMKLDEQLSLILQMFVTHQEHEQQENLNRVERLKEVKALEPLIDVVAQIARQTNFLSINAAVEAARAGQAGSGFAVVAAEIRSLSGKTAAVVKDIGSKIQTVTAGVDKELESAQAKLLNNRTADNMKRVLADIDGMKKRFFEAAQENSMDVGQALDSIHTGQHTLVQQMTEALGEMQFFDVMYQRVAHVREAMTELRDHIGQLAQDLCEPDWQENGRPKLKQRLHEQTERYVMQSQLVTHQEVVNANNIPTPAAQPAPASSTVPKIELF